METYLLEMAEQYAAKCNNCGDTSFDIQIEADFVYSRSHKFNLNPREFPRLAKQAAG